MQVFTPGKEVVEPDFDLIEEGEFSDLWNVFHPLARHWRYVADQSGSAAHFGVAATAQNVHDLIVYGTDYAEGAETQQSNLKSSLEGGRILAERTSLAGGFQPGYSGILGRGTGSGDGQIGSGSQSEAEVNQSRYSLSPPAIHQPGTQVPDETKSTKDHR